MHSSSLRLARHFVREFVYRTSSERVRHQAERSVLERRKECETGKCGNLVPLEAQNCILECISPECYQKTFAEPVRNERCGL